MGFLLVDRVLELHRGARVVAEHQVELAPDFYAYHFPRQPIVPGSMLLECLAQVGSILVEASSNFRLKGLPGYFENAKFRRPVRPGERLRVEMNAERWTAGAAVLRGVILNHEGARSATCVVGMFAAPLEDYFGPEHETGYRQTYARWLDGAELRGFERHPLEVLRHAGA
jgi:3-hydroxyacyl-[acyl-carrier-protein] dehydratase